MDSTIELTHLSRMEFSTIINWTGPFYSNFNRESVSKQWRP